MVKALIRIFNGVRRLSARSFALAFLIVSGHASMTAAGTLCGTVRDAITHDAVVRAGVVVFLPDGAYSGFGGVTDADGSFCITGIPPGTYDIQVKVDGYAAGAVRGVVVTDEGTDVEAEVDLTSSALAPPTPNPAIDQVALQVNLRVRGPARLEVYDPAGRFVRGWQGDDLAAGVLRIRWDLRDARGRPVPAGWYIVRLTAGNRTHQRAMVVVR